MPRNQEQQPTPPASRALRTIPGARLALARLYHRVERGEVDPAIAGRLAQILGLLISSARDHEFAQRLTEVEGTIAAAVKPNGHDRHHPGARP